MERWRTVKQFVVPPCRLTVTMPYARVGGVPMVSAPPPPCPDQWIADMSPDYPPDLIPGLLPSWGVCLIAGETEVGKTLVALEIAQACLAGTPLWGSLQPTRSVSRTMYCLGEHHRETVKELWKKLQIPVPDERAFTLLGPEHRQFLVQRGVPANGAVRILGSWGHGAGLITFDPLLAFATGFSIENDNALMRQLINAMEDVARMAPQAACLVLSHMGKPQWDQDARTHRRRPTYATRGASAIEDSVMACWYMEERAPGCFKLTRRKYKGDAPTAYYLLRDSSTLRHASVTLPVWRGKVRAARPHEEPPEEAEWEGRK